MSETTLILLKPDCIGKGHCGDVIQRFERCNFKIRGIKMLKLTDALLLEHYAHIASRPFFPEVQAFMQQTPVVALAIEGDDVVLRVRDLLGPTNSKDAAPGTIRGNFGVDMMVNVVHASDSVENAKVELDRFFAPGELFSY